MMLSRRSLSARYGPSVASIRDIELNYRPEKFRLRTLHQLDRSLGWTPGTALQLATGDPALPDDEFTQLVADSQAAPLHVPNPPDPGDTADTSAESDAKHVPLGSDDASDTPPLNDEMHPLVDKRSLDAALYRAFGQLRATVSIIKADMTLSTIATNVQEKREANYRIVQGMNDLESLTAKLQDSIHLSTDPDAIANAVINVLDQERSSPGPDPAIETEVCV